MSYIVHHIMLLIVISAFLLRKNTISFVFFWISVLVRAGQYEDNSVALYLYLYLYLYMYLYIYCIYWRQAGPKDISVAFYLYLYLYPYNCIYCIYWRQSGHKDNSVSLAGPQTGGQLGPVSALGTVTSNFATIFGSNVKSHVFCNKNQCHFGQRVQNINLRLLKIKIWAQEKI